MDKIIYSDNFTDDNGNLHYFNTGRDNVSGSHFPNYYVRNKDNYSYTRICNITFNQDKSLVYPIHECFLLTTYNRDNKKGLTNIITIDGIVKQSTITTEDLSITCTPLNYISNVSDTNIHDIEAALKTETNGEYVSINLGIWLHTTDIIDIIIKDISSLAYNEIPNNIYNQFLQCDYQTQYLNNEYVVNEVNMVNLKDIIGTVISTGVYINKPFADNIKNINNNITNATPDYKFLSIIYDDMYSIKQVNTDEIIKPSATQYVQVIDSFININDNYISVKEEGNYIIALKVNMDIHEDTATKMMMSIFLNSDRVNETTCSLYLDPHNKVSPNGFLAGQFQVMLKPSDKLYLKARWTEIAYIENHCTLQITKLNSINK